MLLWAVNCTKSSNNGLTSVNDLKPRTLEVFSLVYGLPFAMLFCSFFPRYMIIHVVPYSSGFFRKLYHVC